MASKLVKPLVRTVVIAGDEYRVTLYPGDWDTVRKQVVPRRGTLPMIGFRKPRTRIEYLLPLESAMRDAAVRYDQAARSQKKLERAANRIAKAASR